MYMIYLANLGIPKFCGSSHLYGFPLTKKNIKRGRKKEKKIFHGRGRDSNPRPLAKSKEENLLIFQLLFNDADLNYRRLKPLH